VSGPWAKYDREFVAAVQGRWDALVGGIRRDDYRAGTVVVAFKLHADGRITEMEVKTNSVSKVHGMLCQRAVLDPAPYEPWPREMRLMVGWDYRHITFTFDYR